MADVDQLVTNALNAGEGVLHLAPAWVPRAFVMPGRRLRLDERDLYALGADRGGIDERWLASTTRADNGPRTPEDEGLSYVVGPGGERVLFAEAVASVGASLVGESIMDTWGRWPILCKLFDNMGPIPHHLHQRSEDVRALGKEHKPEAYYFPPQYNAVGNDFPYTFFGLEPGTTKAEVKACLERWNEGDNGILDLSKAYRLEPGTGWLVPPGVLHAPGSLCTFEVQWGSDVFAMFQSLLEGRVIGWDLLTKDVPEAEKHDLDYIVGLLDWEANVNPTFKQDHFLKPVPADSGEGFADRWIIYGKIGGQDLFSAKELTVKPGAELTLREPAASGVLVVQGRGALGAYDVETPTHIRYGDVTWDEFFIGAEAARRGVRVRNTGAEPLVLLRFFGPGRQ